MTAGRIIKFIVVGVFALFALFSVTMALFSERLFQMNMHKLDSWVQARGKPSTIQTDLVKPCGQLVIEQAGWFERAELLTFYRDEFHFRVDVCVKMTVNRLYRQPEFQKPEIVSMICDDKNPYHELLVRLCRRSGLRP